MRGPQNYQLGPHAAQQVAATVRRVERASRSQQPQRRRSPPGSASPSVLAVGTLTGTLAAGGSAGFTFTIGGTVILGKISGKWYVIQARCGC
jgi:hypothetical protein